jgi:hypothetical protein
LAQSLFLYASLTALVQYELFCGIAHEVEEVRKQRAKKNNKQFYRVAYAGGKQPPEDLNDADALTDWLDERGIIENGLSTTGKEPVILKLNSIANPRLLEEGRETEETEQEQKEKES